MYHIPKDARARKSAQLICKGLEECLAEKPLSQVKIIDIYEKSFVSRSTFYRLFDTITDVLVYQCDNIFEEILQIIEHRTFSSRKERHLCCARAWLNHPVFINTLVENDLGWMIYKTHERHFDSLKKIYPTSIQEGRKSEYFLAILSALISSSMSIYIKNGSTEKLEEAYDIVCSCSSIIAKSLNM